MTAESENGPKVDGVEQARKIVDQAKARIDEILDALDRHEADHEGCLEKLASALFEAIVIQAAIEDRIDQAEGRDPFTSHAGREHLRKQEKVARIYLDAFGRYQGRKHN